MTAREYLERPEAIRQEISRKRTRIETLRRLVNRFSPEFTADRVQSTPDRTRMQAFLAEAADEEREIALLEEKRKQALADTARLIARLPEEKMIRILEMRYLDRLPWEEITERMGGGVSTVYRLHQLALDILTPAPEPED